MTTTSDQLVSESYVSLVRRPSISNRVNEIIELVDNPLTSVAKLTSAISKDQTLVRRVLRQANSPIYGFSRRVKDPNFAVILLGFDALREMVVRSIVTGAFRRMVNSMIRFEAFWDHSIGCGLGARFISEQTGLCDPNDAFVAGLLHDIGYVILNEHVSDDGMNKGGAGTSKGLVSASLPKQDHADVGAWLATHWHLSDDIVTAIRLHHKPASATTHRTLVSIVHTAEVLCHRLQIHKTDYESIEGYDPQALATLGLTEAALTNDSASGYVASIREDLSHAPKFATLITELKQNLVEVMQELSEQERVVLALLYYEGLPIVDISRVLGVSVPDVEQLQTTALARLRAAITLIV
ncbi:MAG: sigma-70 family RNA polymerase sigma factor [Ignavibacteriales bacterium]|nr:sigma-70 family RNA polymerase sigma factor [Ignavibacteriales bacterium]